MVGMSRVTRVALYCVYVLVFVCVVDYAFSWRFIRVAEKRAKFGALRKQAQQAGLPVPLFHSVGSARHDSRKANVVLSAKPPRTIRIGAFGDSFTWGDEVAAGLDFPSQLQKLLGSAGRFEVFNFGNSWHGFHQAFKIWEDYGRLFDLDFILLGPEGFGYLRGATFNHGFPTAPDYLHGRYILEGNDVRFIDVVGEPDFRDRFAQYYRFIPHLSYLRFDRTPPVFIRALLPGDRSLENPFYYSRLRLQDEQLEIDRRLLNKLSMSSSRVILAHINPEVVAVGRRVPGLLSEQIPELATFPYRASHLHFSGMGNWLIAKLFRDLVLGSHVITLPVLDFTECQVPVREKTGLLGDLSAIEVELAGKTMGRLIELAPAAVEEEVAAFDFTRDQNISSLVGLEAKVGGALSSVFVPAASRLGAGSRLSLRLAGTKGKAEIDLGPVRRVHPSLELGTVGLKAEFSMWGPKGPAIRFELPGVAEKVGERAVGAIYLADSRLWEVSMVEGGALEATATKGRHFVFSSPRDFFLDVSSLPAHGQLMARLGGRTPARIQLGCWNKRELKVPVSARP